MYTAVIDATGAYAPGNPSRSEDGQPAREIECDTLHDALDEYGALHTGVICDEWGDPVVVVRHTGRGTEAVAPDGTWGPLSMREEQDLILACVEDA